MQGQTFALFQTDPIGFWTFSNHHCGHAASGHQRKMCGLTCCVAQSVQDRQHQICDREGRFPNIGQAQQGSTQTVFSGVRVLLDVSMITQGDKKPAGRGFVIPGKTGKLTQAGLGARFREQVK